MDRVPWVVDNEIHRLLAIWVENVRDFQAGAISATHPNTLLWVSLVNLPYFLHFYKWTPRRSTSLPYEQVSGAVVEPTAGSERLS